jgi:hypothetical protein
VGARCDQLAVKNMHFRCLLAERGRVVYRSHCIVKTVRWAGHVAGIGAKRCVQNFGYKRRKLPLRGHVICNGGQVTNCSRKHRIDGLRLRL